ncbi:fibro-slime domain-containing protein [Bifidobacterium sp. CP2]|uniref:fibro-slime domain-containing protein n=1 Tax=Bifidobacterium sp. CP2 TaxID=2809025 RepID=UPI001BDD878A|nr:fibro-slime domain-containing protein [Bifidobacterium sp. CP2]MBT1181048.1 fibro-slime domain-containing protein [Bifidobacterium sp. CP2]
MRTSTGLQDMMRRTGALVATLAMIGTAAGVGATAMAAQAGKGASSAAQAAAQDGSAIATKAPAGATMTFNDYWGYDWDNPGEHDGTLEQLNQYKEDYGFDFRQINADAGNHRDSGINQGALKFSQYAWDTISGGRNYTPWMNASAKQGVGSVPAKDGSSAVRQGIVDPTLGNDGYPRLAGSRDIVTADGQTLNTGDVTNGATDSLAYLFNGADRNTACTQDEITCYKTNYPVNANLFQMTDGYYTYDSRNTHARLSDAKDANGNYSWTETKASDANSLGFFPLNNGSISPAVQDLLAHGCNPDKLTDCGGLNHSFGLSMTVPFTQPTNGLTGDKDTTFEFSGDDDVWVYIDDTLVLDIGGRHGRAEGKIDFATGEVTVGGNTTTLEQMYRNAGVTDFSADAGWKRASNGKYVYGDDTQHTLRFFYLERGNDQSNMMLKFNLRTIPQSDVVKIDQTGTPIPGVLFDLYQADGNYAVVDGAAPTATGSTDEQGQFTFVDASGRNITLSQLYAKSHHYVLREAQTPQGYRPVKDIQLELRQDATDAHNVYAVSNNRFATGAIATPRVQTTITDGRVTGERAGGSGKTEITSAMLKDGSLVAVPMRFNGTACKSVSDAKECWQAVTGDAVDGWTQTGEGFAGVLKAAQSNYAKHGDAYNTFAPNSSSQWMADVEDLPGEIGEYYYAAQQGDPVHYAIGYYYIPNDVLQNKDGTDTSGMLRLDSEGYDRKYATEIQVPNIRNILVVQKTDENGVAVKAGTPGTSDSQATFALYADENGAPATKPLAEKQTTDQKVADGRLSLEGAVSFPEANDNTLLETGKAYWVKETAAPKGYRVNEHWTKVVVDATGVHADATAYTRDADGTMHQVASGAKDDVSVNVGVGTLVRTMTQWAGDGGDDPLQYVNGIKQSGTQGADGTLTWTDAPTTEESLRHFQYGYGDTADIPLLKYGYFALDKGWNRYANQTLLETTFASEDGFTDVKVTPCPAKSTTPDGCKALADLTDASALFTGSTIIRVADETTDAHARIQLDKQVQGGDWSGENGRNFTFTLIRTDDGTGDVTVPGATAPRNLAKCDASGLDWSACATASGNDTVRQLTAHTTGAIKAGATQTVGLRQDGTATAGALPELTFTKAGTYTFRLKEDTADPADGWRYDTGKTNGTDGYAVKVVVTDVDGGLDAVVTYGDVTGNDTDGDGIIGKAPTFVNTFVPPVSVLPFTGGMSARDWLVFGGIAAIVAAAGALVANEYRKRKGLMA